MDKMSQYMLVAALLALGLASAFYLWDLFARRGSAGMQLATAGGPSFDTTAGADPRDASGRYATLLAANGLAFLTLWMVFRTIYTGHGPFSNMHEFAAAFSWGIVGAYLYAERRFGTRALGAIVVPIALAVLY